MNTSESMKESVYEMTKPAKQLDGEILDFLSLVAQHERFGKRIDVQLEEMKNSLISCENMWYLAIFNMTDKSFYWRKMDSLFTIEDNDQPQTLKEIWRTGHNYKVYALNFKNRGNRLSNYDYTESYGNIYEIASMALRAFINSSNETTALIAGIEEYADTNTTKIGFDEYLFLFDRSRENIVWKLWKYPINPLAMTIHKYHPYHVIINHPQQDIEQEFHTLYIHQKENAQTVFDTLDMLARKVNGLERIDENSEKSILIFNLLNMLFDCVDVEFTFDHQTDVILS